jgi:hypothetical protein
MLVPFLSAYAFLKETDLNESCAMRSVTHCHLTTFFLAYNALSPRRARD